MDIFNDEGGWKLAKEAVGVMMKLVGQNDPAAKYRLWTASEDDEWATEERWLVVSASHFV